MPKHKTVKKWIATTAFSTKPGPPEIEVLQVNVIETPKQYRLVKDQSKEYRSALRACNYRTTIRKADRCPLYDTREAALRGLEAYYERQVSLATARLNREQEHLNAVQLLLVPEDEPHDGPFWPVTEL